VIPTFDRRFILNIILLGPPGSGKGTQAEKLIEHDNFMQLSTGDLFRDNIARKTPLGIEAQKYIDDGHLVPDDVTNGMVADYLASHHNQLIFDGYPRTIAQAEVLDQTLKGLETQIDYVFAIEVGEEEILTRITNRVICPVCKRSYNLKNRPPKVAGICDYDGAQLITRPDDTVEKVQTRLHDYEQKTAPLMDYYAKQGKLHKVAGEIDAESTYDQIAVILNGHH